MAILSDARSAGEKMIREFHPSSRFNELNQQLRDRLTLSAISAEEARMRDQSLLVLECKSVPLSGFRQAANDSLSTVHYWSDIQKLAVERRLAAQGLPKLALLSAMLRKKHETILKRGKIRNEEEFNLVQEIISQMDYPIDEESRRQLEKLAGDFEARPQRR